MAEARRARLRALQSERDLLRMEKAALENRINQPGTAAPASATDSSRRHARIRQLESERDDLQDG